MMKQLEITPLLSANAANTMAYQRSYLSSFNEKFMEDWNSVTWLQFIFGFEPKANASLLSSMIFIYSKDENIFKIRYLGIKIISFIKIAARSGFVLLL